MRLVYSSRKAPIASLKIEKVIVLRKYLDFIDVFSSNSATELPKYIGINNHLIDLKEGKKLSYKLIHSLTLVEFKTLKTYIETNFANSFIKPLKSPTNALILFVCKKDGSF